MIEQQWRTARSEEGEINRALLMDQNFLTKRTLDRQFRGNGNRNRALLLVNAANVHVEATTLKIDHVLAVGVFNVRHHVLGVGGFRLRRVRGVNLDLDLNRHAFFKIVHGATPWPYDTANTGPNQFGSASGWVCGCRIIDESAIPLPNRALVPFERFSLASTTRKFHGT